MTEMLGGADCRLPRSLTQIRTFRLCQYWSALTPEATCELPPELQMARKYDTLLLS